MIYETIRSCVNDLSARWQDLQNTSQVLAGLMPANAQQLIVQGWGVTSANQVAAIGLQVPNLAGFPPIAAMINLAQINVFVPTYGQFTPIQAAATGAAGLLTVLIGSGNAPIVAAAGMVQSSLDALDGLYAECMQELAEFTSTEGARASLSGIRGSMDDISTYPVFTQDFSYGGGPSNVGGSGGGGSSTTSLGLTAQRAIADVLGRRPRIDDPKSFVAALNTSFMCKELEGHTECTWVQRAAAGLTELGGAITGAQASVYQRTKEAYDAASPLIRALTPLRTDFSAEIVEAARSIVITEFQELVSELGFEGGPRVSRVDDLLFILLDQDFNPQPPRNGSINDPQNADLLAACGRGAIGRLGDALGILPNYVDTIEDEQDLTNFLVILDYANSIRNSWNTFRPNFLGGAQNFLGTQIILLQRSLSVISESVSQVTLAMDSVFLGPAERQTVRIDFPANVSPPMYVADFLNWIDRVTTSEGTTIVQEGGRIGMRTLVQPLNRLRDLVRNSDGRIRHPGAGHPRVRRTLQDLGSQLTEAARLAASV
jgi:hypothetical protein